MGIAIVVISLIGVAFCLFAQHALEKAHESLNTLREINFELEAIRSIMEDTQGQSRQSADKLLKLLNKWDSEGMPSVSMQD